MNNSCVFHDKTIKIYTLYYINVRNTPLSLKYLKTFKTKFVSTYSKCYETYAPVVNFSIFKDTI